MIQAIETRYAGCRFRSRLEARWAVFFDHAGIDWEYEPEGLKVDTPVGRINYLPDFWLPRAGQWVEVKGYLDLKACRRLCALASGLAECGSGNDVAVLGSVPRHGSALWPVQLHQHGGLYGVPWVPSSRSGCPMERPRAIVRPSEETAELLTEGLMFGIPVWADECLDAARQARFEWGESG
jgi:hypothetical protein